MLCATASCNVSAVGLAEWGVKPAFKLNLPDADLMNAASAIGRSKRQVVLVSHQSRGRAVHLHLHTRDRRTVGVDHLHGNIVSGIASKQR
jgi:hypothetical protein